MSKEKMVLNSCQVEEIRTLADQTRKIFGVYGDVPIANDIFMLLDKKDIILCQYPFETSEDSHTDATLTWFETDGSPITFIGLNTSRYYDEQIFALAHELYHFITKTGKAYQMDMEEEDILTEKKADRFAAELLLPKEVLRSKIISEFQENNINTISIRRLLRFIARLQCEWWLPYHSIVNRLLEEEYIDKNIYWNLYQINDRDEKSLYGRIFKSLDEDKYMMLNNKTNRRDISGSVLEIIIQNYEDGNTTEDEFVRLLSLYGKSPEDFGFDLSVRSEDLMELNELFEGGDT